MQITNYATVIIPTLCRYGHFKHKDDPEVIMITGYTYPTEWETSTSAAVVKQNICVSIYGIGNWVNKVSKVSTHNRNGVIDNSLKYGI